MPAQKSIILKDFNLSNAEAILCLEALKHTDSLADAAELLGTDRHALRRLITKHNINWQPRVQQTRAQQKNWEPAKKEKRPPKKPKFQANAARTFSIPVGDVYKAWNSSKRIEWLKLRTKFKVRIKNNNKYMSLELSDKSRVGISFQVKDRYHCQVIVMHCGLANSEQVTKKKAFWTKTLDKLQAYLS